MRPQEDNPYDPRVSIATGRRYRGQTQEMLAEALSQATGEHWSRGMVANLETLKKELTVGTLMVIAGIQQFPYSFYLEGPDSSMGGYVSSLEPVAA